MNDDGISDDGSVWALGRLMQFSIKSAIRAVFLAKVLPLPWGTGGLLVSVSLTNKPPVFHLILFFKRIPGHAWYFLKKKTGEKRPRMKAVRIEAIRPVSKMRTTLLQTRTVLQNVELMAATILLL